MAKLRRENTNQTHLQGWREMAVRVGWSKEDLDQFELLHVTSDPAGVKVLEIHRDRILYKSCWILRSEGIGTGGISVSKWLSIHRTQTWRRSIDTPTAIQTPEVEDPRGKWCPCHAFDRNPTCSMCGFAGIDGPVMALVPCGCRDFSLRSGRTIHQPGCPVPDFEAESLLEDSFGEAPAPAAEASKPALEFGTPAPKKKRKKVPKKVLQSLSLDGLK